MKTVAVNQKLSQMQGLVNELAEAYKIQNCDYHLVQDKIISTYDGKPRFFLVRLSDNKVVADGYCQGIVSWLNIRNIDRCKVYGIELFTNQPKK